MVNMDSNKTKNLSYRNKTINFYDCDNDYK